MSLSKFKETAKLAGFSKILGAPANNFILFDKDTDGRTGRPIFIDGSLAEKFNGIGSEADMTYIFHRIKQLKAVAASINSYSNANDAMEYMNLVGRAKITYKLLTFTGDQQRTPGVYITDVDLANFSDGEAGVYRVEKDRNNWRLSARRQRSVTSGFAAINGLCRDMEQAAVDIMPPMLESAYSGSKAQLNADGYDLFYNPPALYDDGKEWKTPAQKKVTQEVTAARLAQAMKDATVRKQPVQWLVHGDGAKVLQKALQRAKVADLSGHTLMFMAPNEVVADILPLARKLKMNLHEDVMKIHDHDLASKQLQWGRGNRKKLVQELEKYGMDDQAYLLSKKLGRDRISLTKKLSSLSWKAFNLTTMVIAPAAAAMGPDKIAGKVSDAVLSGMSALDTAETFRNHIAATSNIKNPAYNPHLNPHKSVDQLNLAAKKASGSVAKTFVDVVKGRIKGG